MNDSRTLLRAYGMLALVMLLWAGNSIIGRAVRDDIPPFTLAFVRWTGALIVLLPFAARHLREDWEQLVRHWPIVLLLGLSGVAAFNGFLYLGLHYTNASNGLLLQAAIPPLVLAFDFALFGVRPQGWQLFGVMLSVLGVLTIIFQADVSAVLALRFGYGDVLIMCGVLGWALYTSLLRKRPKIHALTFLAATFVIAAMSMLPFAALELDQALAIDWRPQVAGAFLYVAVLPSVVSYFLFNQAVADIGAGRAGQAISLMPLFGAVLATLLLGEPFLAYHAIGMALILGGIVIAALMTRQSMPGATGSQ
ncbi:DMT family transporter [Terrihabitans sp. B22-R8]|uniref:DMT family transporter n=1 Tax=Terrihabitans sp. B22-R8 TaxID=3425128 RepID=UPI00403D149E